MRKRQKVIIKYIVLWIVILPIWVVKRIIRNLKRALRETDLMKSDIHEIDSLTDVEFEEFLAVLFRKKGLIVQSTATTGDFGADLILEGDGFRTAVQAKCYSNLVGLEAVQEVLGARDIYKADKLMVITNNYYSNAAKKQAASSNVILWDRGNLIQEVLEQPDKDVTASEYLMGFIKKSATDYKLILGLLACVFVYIPVLGYGISAFRNSNPSDSNNVIIHNSEYNNLDSPPATPNPSPVIQIDTTQYPNSIDEVNNSLSLSHTRPGYLLYKNSQFGYSIQFPEEYSPANPPEYGSGYAFTSMDGQAQLTVFGINNTGYTTSDLYDKVCREANGPLGYRVLKASWFVVTWSENGRTYYRKSILGKGSKNTFVFTFPEEQKTFYDEVITNMEKSFTHGTIDITHW